MEYLTQNEDGVAEFAVFSSPPEGTITIRADAADRVEGLLAQFFGRSIENKNQVVHLTLWSNINRRKKFGRFAALRLAEFNAHTPRTTLFAFKAKDFDKLLDVLVSPLTEVFTGYAKHKAFEANVRLYNYRLELEGAKATVGYRESAVLTKLEDVHEMMPDYSNLDTLSKPVLTAIPAVRMLVGWEGYEECLAAEHNPGPIQDIFELLRKGCLATASCHVQFQELVPALDPEEVSSEEDEPDSIPLKQETKPETKTESKVQKQAIQAACAVDAVLAL